MVRERRLDGTPYAIAPLMDLSKRPHEPEPSPLPRFLLCEVCFSSPDDSDAFCPCCRAKGMVDLRPPPRWEEPLQ